MEIGGFPKKDISVEGSPILTSRETKEVKDGVSDRIKELVKTTSPFSHDDDLVIIIQSPQPILKEKSSRQEEYEALIKYIMQKKNQGDLDFKDFDINDSKSIEEFENLGFPVHFAVQTNHYNLLTLLANAGADLNRRDHAGKTPIYLAVEDKNIKILKILLENQADPNIEDNNGLSPLRVLMREHLSILEMIHLLRNNGARLESTLFESGRPLADIIKDARVSDILRLEEMINEEITKGDPKQLFWIMHALVDNVTISSSEIGADCLLRLASRFILNEVDLNTPDSEGKTLFQKAEGQNNQRLMRLLKDF